MHQRQYKREIVQINCKVGASIISSPDTAVWGGLVAENIYNQVQRFRLFLVLISAACQLSL